MNIFRVAFFCLLMASFGAFAQQGSMQSPAQTPQAQNPQAQQPGAPPPYAQPQNPGTTPTPQAQAPQGEQSQAPPMHASGSDADAQVSALTQVLNLNSDQQAKIKTILEDQHQQAVGVVNDASLSHEAKLQKVHGLRQQTIDKVRATLTNDDQRNKFDAMVQSQNERIREREQQEQQQNNTPPPK
ncbi:MAG TPA: hypothetical protein VFQ00_05950 [Terriglobales bacterium]|nr:hypothetical protein [Terriglobales bacterium]